MNITANTVVSKLFVAFVAASMLVMLASPAKAATAEELQAQIDALMAQISALQGSTAPAATPAKGCTFTRALTVGSEGADVKCLQDYLTPKYFTNAGGSTGYFGSVSAAAVAAWQTANGVMPAAGYFGPVSQAKYAALMAAAPDTDDSDDTDDTDGDDDTTSGDLSGEASLSTFEVADGEDSDDVEEGSEDVEVAEFTVEFSDGDAMITRLDIALDGTANTLNTEADPWDIFGDISLMVDGDVVKTIDASDKDNYLDEDNGSLRFAGLDIVGMEDEEVVIVVSASVAGSVDSAGSATLADWDVLAGPMRFVDADDVTTTETGSTGDIQAMDGSYNAALAAEFTIDEAGAGDDLDLEASDEDPDATTIQADEDDNTEAAIFAFDLSAEDSDGDVTINEIMLSATVTVASNIDDLVNDFRLEIDGESYDVESYTGTGLTVTNLTFDIDGDLTIPADEVVTAVLYADFEDMEVGDEGSTITAQVEAADIDAEGADDIDVDGTLVTGETHTVRTEGVSVTLVDESVLAVENADAGTDDEATFTLEFDVTSFGDTIYLPFGASSSTDLTSGVEFSIINTNTNVVVSTGIAIASLDMDDDGETNSFKISDGDTQTFTLEVTYDPTVSGSYKLRLDDINFAVTDVATATQTQDVSDEDIDTSSATITS